MERYLVELARKRGFDVIVATESSPVTQGASQLLGYEVEQVIRDVKNWRPSPDADPPFAAAPDDAQAWIVYKLLN